MNPDTMTPNTILVVDTETTGLPRATLSEETIHLWPYIVQFSYLVYDVKKNKVIKIKDSIIKIPENIIICDEVIKIHGITNEKSQTNGINIMNIILDFYEDVKKSDLIVGHNLAFDINIIKAEIIRLIKQITSLINQDTERKSRRLLKLEPDNSTSNLKTCSQLLQLLETKQKHCTMLTTTKLCNIKRLTKTGKEFIKFPKLSELHEKLFNSIPQNLHNSLNDVIICLRCYYMLTNETDIKNVNNDIKLLINELCS